jgi:hypothetical protein
MGAGKSSISTLSTVARIFHTVRQEHCGIIIRAKAPYVSVLLFEDADAPVRERLAVPQRPFRHPL